MTAPHGARSPIRFTVRPPGAHETVALAAILEAMETHYAGTSPDPLPAAARLLAGTAPARALVAAAEDGRFLGVALYAPLFPGVGFGDILYLKDVFVREDARGQGVARALIGAIAAEARAQGCERVEWSTDRANAVARAAYAALGVAERDKVSYQLRGEPLARLAATAAGSRPPS
jgi:GNAT superfamily N-acetyltransferase